MVAVPKNRRRGCRSGSGLPDGEAPPDAVPGGLVVYYAVNVGRITLSGWATATLRAGTLPVNYSHRNVRVCQKPVGEMVVSVRLATFAYWEQCWFASDITSMNSVRARLCLSEIPLGVAVKVFGAQPKIDTAASVTSISLNISVSLPI